MCVPSSMIHNSQKGDPDVLSVDDWINKMQYIHTMGYDSGIKRDEVLIYANMDDLESIMPSRRGQTLKATHYMILFIANIQNKQISRQNAD